MLTQEQHERLAQLAARRADIEHLLAQQSSDEGFRLRMEAVLESIDQQVREVVALRTLQRRDRRTKGIVSYETLGTRIAAVPLRFIRDRSDR